MQVIIGKLARKQHFTRTMEIWNEQLRLEIRTNLCALQLSSLDECGDPPRANPRKLVPPYPRSKGRIAKNRVDQHFV